MWGGHQKGLQAGQGSLPSHPASSAPSTLILPRPEPRLGLEVQLLNVGGRLLGKKTLSGCSAPPLNWPPGCFPFSAFAAPGRKGGAVKEPTSAGLAEPSPLSPPPGLLPQATKTHPRLGFGLCPDWTPSHYNGPQVRARPGALGLSGPSGAGENPCQRQPPPPCSSTPALPPTNPPRSQGSNRKEGLELKSRWEHIPPPHAQRL